MNEPPGNSGQFPSFAVNAQADAPLQNVTNRALHRAANPESEISAGHSDLVSAAAAISLGCTRALAEKVEGIPTVPPDLFPTRVNKRKGRAAAFQAEERGVQLS